ncbi:hypothetical protein M885DRAFT_627207 [Pelagophyceae sp. CCMP2097]|nr:hypothetical protein M885DRAFT_627207 [Pelagophyceae sp. CCMP2097]
MMLSREVKIGAVSAVAAVAAYELLRQQIVAALRRHWYCEVYGIRETANRKSKWWSRWVRVLRDGARRSDELRRQHVSDQSLNDADDADASDEPSLPPHVVCEMLSRHEAFFGSANHLNIRNARVCILGLGGVGSHTAMMLARAGVAYLRIVDFDHVSLSSLNRHAVAALKDVGTPKASTMRDAIRGVAPFVTVDARNLMLTKQTAEELLGGGLDLVVDAIDDVETKAVLLATCVRLGLRVISAMGAGAKADPTRLCVAPLADAVHDPLAAKLRWRLRQLGVEYGGSELGEPPKGDKVKRAPIDEAAADLITCVYSHERPRCTLLPLTEEQIAQGAKNYGAVDVDHFRVRVLPVLGASPALMGQAIAAVALCGLAGQPIAAVPREPISRKLKEKMFNALKKREARRERGPAALPEHCGWVDVRYEDLEYVICEVWRGRCAVTRRKLERKPLNLARWWQAARPFTAEMRTPPPAENDDDGAAGVSVVAEDLILLAPNLADRLDAELDGAARECAPAAPSRARLREAAAVALGGAHYVDIIDARVDQMRQLSGGPWR